MPFFSVPFVRSNTSNPENIFNGSNSTSVLGDSISHGAFAVNINVNGWVKLLGRSLNAEYGTSSYGYTPYLNIGSGELLSLDIHRVQITGDWEALTQDKAGEYVSGLGYKTNKKNDSLTFTIPSFMVRGLINYTTLPEGGEVDVYVNDVLVNTISTKGEVNTFNVVRVDFNRNIQETVKVKIINKESKPFIFGGISYLNTYKEHVCNNFSQSARRLVHVTENVIKEVCSNSANLIMALGFNDSVEINDDYKEAVRLRIDWIIYYANNSNVNVVVPDFCWSMDESNWMRQELVRLSEETFGTYVDLPSKLKKEDGSPADTEHLVKELNMWVDGAHPNIIGNEWIFEEVSTAMKLSITSKEDALNLYDYESGYIEPYYEKNNGGTLTGISLFAIGTALALRKRRNIKPL